MVAAPSIDVLTTALAPVQVLRGEQTELETSLRESFAELEALHDELAEWQRELTRQQAELDQRAAAVADAEIGASSVSGEFADMQQQLAQAQEYSRQLEEENVEQLQTTEDLQRQLVAVQTELRTVRSHAEELAAALATERDRAVDEHRLWSSELRDMRRLLERQSAALESLNGDSSAGAAIEDSVDEAAATPDNQSSEPESDDEAPMRTAELRRRAHSRRSRRRSN